VATPQAILKAIDLRFIGGIYYLEALSPEGGRFLFQGSQLKGSSAGFPLSSRQQISLRDSSKCTGKEEFKTSAIHPRAEALGFLASMDKLIVLILELLGLRSCKRLLNRSLRAFF
jgi:hypothetical protein